MKTMSLLVGATLAGALGLFPARMEAAATPPAAGAAAQVASPKPVAEDPGESPCHTVVVYELGKADNFAPPPDPVSPSLALDAMLQTGHPVRYDEGTCDHFFGDSFKIDPCVVCCGVCSATLEITLKGCGSALDCNDYIYVGKAPFSQPGGYLLWGGYVTEPHCGKFNGNVLDPDLDTHNNSGRQLPTAPVVKRIELDPRKVAELLCEQKATTLDFFIQDDQIVDSARLITTKP